MKLPSRETAAIVTANLLTREETAELVAKLSGRKWGVGALDAVRQRKTTVRRPAFPEPVLDRPKVRSPLWWPPDVEAWVPHAFPAPMPEGEGASNGAT